MQGKRIQYTLSGSNDAIILGHAYYMSGKTETTILNVKVTATYNLK